MTPNNNLSVLPFYPKLEDQNARKWWIYDRVYPLFCPTCEMLPFQISLPYFQTPSLTSFEIYKADGTLVADITSTIGITIKNIGSEQSIVVFPGNDKILNTQDVGRYYAKVCFNECIIRYSEIWTAVEDMTGFLRLDWWNKEDFTTDGGTIVYTSPAFKNRVYLDADIAKPEYVYEEDGEDRDGYYYPTKQTSEKRYKFAFIASEYMLDALRLIRMADYIRVSKCEDAGRIYVPDTFLLSEEWEADGDVARVSAEFDTLTVAKKINKAMTAGYLTLTPKLLTLEPESSTSYVTVDTDLTVDRHFTDVDWLTQTLQTALGRLKVEASQNSNRFPRMGIIVVEAENLVKVVEVYQKEAPYLYLEPDTLTFDGINPTSQSVNIKTNKTVSSVVASSDWIHVTRVGKLLTVTCDENLDEQRTGTITVTAGTLTATCSVIQTVGTLALKFTATGAQTVALSGTGNLQLETSYDGEDWADWDSSEMAFGDSTHPKIYIRSKESSTEISLSNNFTFSTNELVDVYGKVTRLIDRDYTGGVYFSGLFKNCTALRTAPELPSLNLNAYAYYQMFWGCTSLTSAPALPATTLASSCYSSMFSGCTGLTTAPALPATTLASSCYSSMFYGCTSLTSAPALPATTLANNCYSGMFQDCTSLTTAPALPAMTLAALCYSQMFQGCTGLTTAPALPATTLADSCYYNMFRGCTGLTTAPALPATTLALSCYNSMFRECTGLTTAPALPATTLASSCYSYMFYGCTSLTTAPVTLPATTLASSCYLGMFYGCTSLTSAPVLPATTLAQVCYSNMFNGCTGLTTAPALPATTLAHGCYNSMFYNCTGLTTAPALPATTLADYCYNYMFIGCTGLTSAPALPATTLASSCYSYMFQGCTGLTSAPALPATTLAYSCYRYMFSRCERITKAPVLQATVLAIGCYESMFNECRALAEVEILATDISASNALNGWLYNVAATGTFKKKTGVTYTSGPGGIPTGWTVVDE